jgi:hypothetical protein
MADRIRPHSYLAAPRPNQAAVAFVVTDEAFRARVHVARGRHRWAPRRSASSACRGGHADDVGYRKRQRCPQQHTQKEG